MMTIAPGDRVIDPEHGRDVVDIRTVQRALGISREARVMTAIALGQSSSVSNPVLAEFIRDGGYVVDPFKLQYQILDATTDGKRLVPIVVYPNPADPTCSSCIWRVLWIS